MVRTQTYSMRISHANIRESVNQTTNQTIHYKEFSNRENMLWEHTYRMWRLHKPCGRYTMHNLEHDRILRKFRTCCGVVYTACRYYIYQKRNIIHCKLEIYDREDMLWNQIYSMWRIGTYIIHCRNRRPA